MLGTTANDPSLEGDEGTPGVSSTVQAVVNLYGPSDFLSLPDQFSPEQRAHMNDPVAHLFGGSIWNADADPARISLAKQASPVTHVSAQSCPFLIAQGALDAFVPVRQSEELDRALKAAGVPSTLIVLPDKGHAFGFNDHATTQAIIAFLQQQLDVK
jgi:dipeptidyl aminopeptidase/acylaminoacyl peptidase